MTPIEVVITIAAWIGAIAVVGMAVCAVLLAMLAATRIWAQIVTTVRVNRSLGRAALRYTPSVESAPTRVIPRSHAREPR